MAWLWPWFEVPGSCRLKRLFSIFPHCRKSRLHRNKSRPRRHKSRSHRNQSRTRRCKSRTYRRISRPHCCKSRLTQVKSDKYIGFLKKFFHSFLGQVSRSWFVAVRSRYVAVRKFENIIWQLNWRKEPSCLTLSLSLSFASYFSLHRLSILY